MKRDELEALLLGLVTEFGLERVIDGREATYDRYVAAGKRPQNRVSLAIRSVPNGGYCVSVKRSAAGLNRVEDVFQLEDWDHAKALFAASVAVQRLGSKVQTRTDWSSATAT